MSDADVVGSVVQDKSLRNIVLNLKQKADEFLKVLHFLS